MSTTELLEEIKAHLLSEIKAELMTEMKAEIRYKVDAEVNVASMEVKMSRDDLKKELRDELMLEIRNSNSLPVSHYQNEIKRLVNNKFTRTDLGHRCNSNAVSVFSLMVRDAFKVDRLVGLTQEQGEKALEMVKELFEVVDKHTTAIND